MEKKQKTFAKRVTGRIAIWAILSVLVVSYVILHFESKATREFYAEIYHNKMLITNEYTRRVISDVYVAATNNIYYLEHTLDQPDIHKETMARIVASGTRVRSCGISFIEDFYPEKGHHFCPFAWRNGAQQETIYSENMGDADLDYLKAEWFNNIITSDSAQWSEPFFDSYDERTALSSYMTPIHDQNGRPIAVLGADVSLDWLTAKLEETDSTINKRSMFMASLFNMKSSSFIIYRDGTFLTKAHGQHIMKDNFYTLLDSSGGSDVEGLISSMKACEEEDNNSFERFLVNGEECYVFYIPVKYTKWLFVTLVPCKPIDMLSYLNALTVIVMLILGTLIILIITYYYIKNGMEPIKQLILSVDAMSKGKFDTPMPEVKHNDEICQLRDSIEEMQYTVPVHKEKPC